MNERLASSFTASDHGLTIDGQPFPYYVKDDIRVAQHGGWGNIPALTEVTLTLYVEGPVTISEELTASGVATVNYVEYGQGN